MGKIKKRRPQNLLELPHAAPAQLCSDAKIRSPHAQINRIGSLNAEKICSPACNVGFIPERRAARRLPAVLYRSHDPRADPCTWRVSWWIASVHSSAAITALLIAIKPCCTLEADAALRQVFRQRLLALFASRQLLTFYRQRRILPDSGFFLNGCAFWATAAAGARRHPPAERLSVAGFTTTPTTGAG